MVRGIDTFKEFFKGFEDNYVIIGGTACEIHEDLYAQVPRATKDIDIILVVEALSAEFVAKFWEFVKKGNYEQRNKGVNENVEPKHEYFRFKKPANSAFPYQVELFSRSLGLMNFPEEARITPIPVDEDLSSLSAILMDEDYYRFTIEHSLQEDGVHIANIESLSVIHLSDDTDLIVSTLWGYIEPQDAFSTERRVNDFYRIKDCGVVINSERFNQEHAKCRAFIEKAVSESLAKHIVVATHHVPSFQLVSPDFQGSPINGAFTAELGNFIAYSRIDYWIYGHSHRNIDRIIGNTQCVSNQLGYVSHGESESFDSKKCIDHLNRRS